VNNGTSPATKADVMKAPAPCVGPVKYGAMSLMRLLGRLAEIVAGLAVQTVAMLLSDSSQQEVPASSRIDKGWLIFISIENIDHDRCVDLFGRPDGTYGFEEFRCDVEDWGSWTPVSFFSTRISANAEVLP
jgi:hypothetical protein